MEYRQLGPTGLNVSVIGIGTWQLSGPLQLNGRPDGFPYFERNEAVALMRELFDKGINYVDTAPIYGDGEGENRVAEAVKGNRQNIVIGSKFGLSAVAGKKHVNFDPRLVEKTLHASLKRLQTDYLDIYFFHSPPELSPAEDCLEVLEKLRNSGKIRHVGLSSLRTEVTLKLLKHKLVEVVFYKHSMINEPSEILKAAKKLHKGSIVRGVFEEGFFSGRYKNQYSSEDIRSGRPAKDTALLAEIEALVPHGYNLPQMAAKFVMQQTHIHCMVAGSRSLNDYGQLIAASEMPPLSSGLVRQII